MEHKEVSMRLRNVKGAKEQVERSKYIVLDPKSKKEKWATLFSNTNPICIEIGMGKGNFIIENAIQNPNINYIGIEKYYSVLTKALKRLEQLELPNLKIIAMDAVEIEEIFAQEIDTIYLNFSDPWPKARHARRRLTSYEFLDRYASIFKNQARIIMKTDHRKLFEYSIQTLTEYGYHIDSICLNLYQEPLDGNIPTEYEEKFSRQGAPIYRIEVHK